MSVKIRKYRHNNEKWEVDIYVEFSDGSSVRKRLVSPATSKSGSRRWGEALEREILLGGPPKPKNESPSLEEFSKVFMEDHPEANRHKPSGIAAKETIFRVHLVPFFGSKKLDEITSLDVQKLKGHLKGKAPKTINNILTVLNTMLKKAVNWGVIERMPCKVELLKVPDKEADFFTFADYDCLVRTAEEIGDEEYITILLGGDAGLRCGEIMALRWKDVDFSNRQIRVQRSEWKGHETDPKGRRTRTVPMTKRLAQALYDHQHLVSDRVLCRKDGSGVSQKMVRNYVLRSCRLAQIEPKGPHTLRHTFCSHLAMRGAPVVSIQEVAGHADLSTTMRYMHLSPKAVDDAIRLLEEPAPSSQFSAETGEIENEGRTG
jgi:integrase